MRKITPVRIHDENEILEGAGVKWPVDSGTIVFIFFILLFGCIISIVLAFIGFSSISENPTLGISLTIVGILLGYLTIRFGTKIDTSDIAILFKKDNKTYIREDRHYPKFPPKSISSIQYRRRHDAEPDNTTPFEVIMLNLDGMVEAFPGHFSEDEAIQLTTQLTKALNEIRAAMAIKSSIKDGVLHMEIDADALDDIDPLAP